MEEIDAVITWVNGQDPVCRKKKLTYLKKREAGAVAGTDVDGRFFEAGEVKYCIHSIRKFAPWIRNIYLVTDEQCPAWLSEQEALRLNITITDHRIIFRDHLDSLPTFNSISIESLLWKIPGLSEKYIVFNDDFFLISHVLPDDFFIDNKPVIRGEWRAQKQPVFKRIYSEIKRIIKTKNLFLKVDGGHISAQINAAKLIGFKQEYVSLAHAPYSMKVSNQREFYKNHPDLLAHNVNFRFRNKDQFQPISIFAHLMIKSEQAILRDPHETQKISVLKSGAMSSIPAFYNLKQSTVKFLCFQDMPFLNEECLSELRDFLNARIFS